MSNDFVKKNNFGRNNCCPVCNSNKYELRVSKYKNVYSDLISKYLNIDEKYLIEIASFCICLKCTAKYWKNPISKKLRTLLYTEILPIHPKGTDASGKYFSVKGIEEKICGLKDSDPKRIRILNGYFSSFKFKSEEEALSCKKVLKNVDENNKIQTLEVFFKRGPKKFSRHAGFRKSFLNEYIIECFKNQSNGEIKYIEYGCPTWGPLSVFVESDLNCLSIIPNNSIFWSNYLNVYHDRKHLNIIKEENLKFSFKKFNGAVLGLILILDHLENPFLFLKRFLECGVKAIALIVEKTDMKKGLPIQHLTGWNKKSLIHLANSLNLSLKFFNDEHDDYIFAFLEI